MEDATKRNKKGKKDSDAKERSRRRSDSNLILHLLKEDQVEGVADNPKEDPLFTSLMSSQNLNKQDLLERALGRSVGALEIEDQGRANDFFAAMLEPEIQITMEYPHQNQPHSNASTNTNAKQSKDRKLSDLSPQEL